MSRKRVYISGPITLGDPTENFAAFCSAFYRLAAAGFAPFNPGLTMLLPGNATLPHDLWMEIDLPWVGQADAVLRLAGDSVGADREVRHARLCGIPIFHEVDEVVQWRQSLSD